MSNHTPTCPICHQPTTNTTRILIDQTSRRQLLTSYTLCHHCLTDLGRHMETMQRGLQEVPKGWK